MIHVLLDTNVLLDVLLRRQPHAAASEAVWTAAERGKIRGFVAAHSVTTIHYLVQHQLGAPMAKSVVARVLRTLSAAAVDRAALEEALAMKGTDFEDNVAAAAARLAGCEAIVTRDPKGFRGSGLRVLQPEMMLALIGRVN